MNYFDLEKAWDKIQKFLESGEKLKIFDKVIDIKKAKIKEELHHDKKEIFSGWLICKNYPDISYKSTFMEHFSRYGPLEEFKIIKNKHEYG